MRRQCAVLDLVDTIADHAADLFDGKLPSKTRSCIARIRSRRLNILSEILHTPTGAIQELGPQRHRQYLNIKKSMVQVLDMFWPGERAEIDGNSLINAALVMAEDTRTQIPEKRRIREDWDYLTGSLFTLLGHIDPDISDQAGQKTGLRVAEVMEEAIKGRDVRPTQMNKARIVEAA
jgi:hypothetical protein